MKIILLIASIALIFFTVALAVFIEPKSGNVQGSGWTVPFWPFVMVIALAINPYIHDLVKAWLRAKVDIAKAENPAPAKESLEKTKSPAPPSTPPEPTDTAKG